MGEELRELLGQVDDDYLIGLGNKGILKRAYKDLEQESPVADWGQGGAQGREDAQKQAPAEAQGQAEKEAPAGAQGQAKRKASAEAQEKMRAGIQVKLREETCVICAPLGESTCTCPSRSMCRHIVTAILWLKKNLGAGDAGTEAAGGIDCAGTEAAGKIGSAGTEAAGKIGSAGTEAAGEIGGAGKESAGSSGETGMEAGGAGKGAVPDKAGESDQTGQTDQVRQAGQAGKAKESGGTDGAGKTRFSEFLELPAERLVKACSASHYRRFLAHVRTGGLPPVEVSSIVTVELPWEKAVVKLLEPLSYSACTCHSKDLCTHKAQALLVWRLREGVCTLDELEAGQEAAAVLDLGQVRAVCENLREAVKLQLCTGLSRQSPEVSVSMERLAVICHRAGLADMERSLRGAAGEYTQYFERQSRFREEELLCRLLGLYRLAGRIQGEEDQRAVQALVGTFRDAYELVGKLRLTGIGSRSFQSKTGYEGEIYYFLDEAGGRYLTWTDARPMFYEGTGRRTQAALEYSQTPWGLNCRREQLFQMQIELTNARLAPGGRLSASQETRGEILGAKNLYDEELCRRIIWDYRKLLEGLGVSGSGGQDGSGPGGDGIGEGTEDRKGEQLALVGAVRWGEAAFDKAAQRFSWELFDAGDRRIYVSLRYTKEEKFILRLLERMEKRLRERKYASLVLFGSLYLDEGRLCLYPIEFWMQEDRQLLDRGQRQMEREEMVDNKTADEGKEGMPGTTEISHGSKWDQNTLDIVEQYLKGAVRQLADLFVSGLQSSPEELEDRILECSREGEELGFHYAGEKLAELGGLLKGRRHQMEFSPEPLLELWESLQCYLGACIEKVSMDRVRLSMKGEAQTPPEGI